MNAVPSGASFIATMGSSLSRRASFCVNGAQDDAGCVAHHECDLLRCHLGRGRDQVALVLAVIVVDHDDHFAARNGGDCGIDRIELAIGAGCHIVSFTKA